MAERIVSPGVFTRENDLSFLAQGVGQIGAAFVGPFKQGPAFIPTIVRSQSEFQQIFGTPDGTYYTEYAVQNYLREAGAATIVRVGGINGYKQVKPLGILISGSTNGTSQKLISTLHSTAYGLKDVGFIQAETTITSSATIPGSFVISGLISSGSAAASVSASILATATNDVADVFGESPFGAKAAYAYTFFENIATSFTGSSDIIGNRASASLLYLPDQNFEYDAQEASTPWVVSQLVSGDRYELFRFHTLGHGTPYNTKYKIGISNVKAAGQDSSTDYSTFSVTLRSYGDSDKKASIIESFGNVNLDPSSPRYIARVIGDRWFTIDDNGKITENGDYSNKSIHFRVEVSEPGSFPISAAPFGHGAYTNPIATNNSTEASYVPAVIYQTGSANNTTTSTVYYSGMNFDTAGVAGDNSTYLNPIPNGAVAGANTAFSFDSQLSYVMTGSAGADLVKRQFILGFQGGFDGVSPTVKIALAGDDGWGAANTQGLNCSKSTASGSLGYSKAINALSNPDEYDINLVSMPGINRELHPAIVTKMIDMVENRQDCFYIADFTDYNSSITTATEQAQAVDSNYAACYYPWMKTIDSNTNKLTTVPPSTLLPAVFASSDRLSAEWFAPAGLNRGGITGAVSVLNRLTHAERDILYENKVNPIATFPGQGIVAFGQKTLQDRASALDRINVRRLLITMKKFIASTSRYLVFEQNTTETRARFINTVTPYLEGIQQRQGLYAFNVVMDESNNTPDVIDRNILAGAIFLQPTKTAEFIVIDFNILPTGASFSA
jgi:hypothetical protein